MTTKISQTLLCVGSDKSCTSEDKSSYWYLITLPNAQLALDVICCSLVDMPKWWIVKQTESKLSNQDNK